MTYKLCLLLKLVIILCCIKKKSDADVRVLSSNLAPHGADEEPSGHKIHTERQKVGWLSPRYRWPNATVVYTLDPAFAPNETRVIYGAMAEIENYTCVRFRRRIFRWLRTDGFLYIERGAKNVGCSSNVGFVRMKPQNLTLDHDGCIVHAVIIHELLHTLGFHHVQSRPDRDHYVTVNLQNVDDAQNQNNFDKLDPAEVTTFSVPYDYASVMHYNPYAFTSHIYRYTIEPKKSNVNIGQRHGLSPLDITKVRRMYNCPTSMGHPIKEFVCANGLRIMDHWRCNRMNDCGDHSDEAGCQDVCEENQFQCDNGKCVQAEEKCNGFQDCGDKSDETNCESCSNNSLWTMFHCSNGRCVMSIFRCDGKDHCGDGSDEIDCGMWIVDGGVTYTPSGMSWIKKYVLVPIFLILVFVYNCCRNFVRVLNSN